MVEWMRQIVICITVLFHVVIDDAILNLCFSQQLQLH